MSKRTPQKPRQQKPRTTKRAPKSQPLSTETALQAAEKCEALATRLFAEEDRRNARLRRAVLAVGAVRKGSVPARIYRLIQVARMTIYGDWAADVANPAKVHRPEDAVGRRRSRCLRNSTPN